MDCYNFENVGGHCHNVGDTVGDILAAPCRDKLTEFVAKKA